MPFPKWLYLKIKLCFTSTLYFVIQHNPMKFTMNYRHKMSWNTEDKDSHTPSHIQNPFTVSSSGSYSSSLFDWSDVSLDCELKSTLELESTAAGAGNRFTAAVDSTAAGLNLIELGRTFSSPNLHGLDSSTNYTSFLYWHIMRCKLQPELEEV